MVNHTLELEDKSIAQSTSSADPRIGRMLLKYRFLAEIGQGGMSIVYRGRDERLGRDVAIKVLHSFLAKNADCRARLAREANTVAKLQHPNILQIFDYSGEDDSKTPGELFIVTELVEGVTLKEFAQQYHLHEIPELGALIIWEIALALQHAHAYGVVHRDIKPENIMIRSDGVLKLMDFGIAQVGNQESLTMTGTLLGSPAHMAPETIEGKASDHRADLFSLSTVLYWLVTGHLPFSGSSAHALLKAIVDGRFTLPQQFSARISDDLNNVILRGMAIDPDERFNSAEEMAGAIHAALAELGIKPASADLKRILAAPDIQMDSFKKQIEESCFVRVEELRNIGETARAMSLLGRLLADNPDNEKAQQLLAGYEPKRVRPRWPIWVLSSFVVTILALTTLMSYWFERRVSPAQLPTSHHVLESGVSALQEDPKIAAAKPVLLPTEPQKPKELTLSRSVVVSVTPFADLYVDGKLSAENISHTKLSLPIGEHILTFKHQFAATEERRIVINKKSENQHLSVVLENVKPAALVISSNVEADIAVGGVYKGTTNASLVRPIIIPLPKKTHSIPLEVVVSKPGYEPKIATPRFVAGQTKTLQVDLSPSKKNS